jgi:hypothetical protein
MVGLEVLVATSMQSWSQVKKVGDELLSCACASALPTVDKKVDLDIDLCNGGWFSVARGYHGVSDNLSTRQN